MIENLPAFVAAKIEALGVNAADAATCAQTLCDLWSRTNIHTDDPDSALFDFAGKIEQTVTLLSGFGLTEDDYIAAAIKRPPLFYTSPQTVNDCIRGTVDLLSGLGVTGPDYTKAALKQPPLFYQSPQTIAGHARLIERLHRKGLLRASVQKTINTTPMHVCLSNDNYHLRYVFARKVGITPAQLLRKPRGQVEAELAAKYRHNPENKTIAAGFDDWKKAQGLSAEFAAASAKEQRHLQACHRALKAMARTKLLKSYKVA